MNIKFGLVPVVALSALAAPTPETEALPTAAACAIARANLASFTASYIACGNANGFNNPLCAVSYIFHYYTVEAHHDRVWRLLSWPPKLLL